MRPRTTILPTGLFLLATALGGSVAWQAERAWRADQRDAATKVAASAAFALEQQVSRALSATYTLAALVHRDEEMADFEHLAAALMPLYGGVSSLQLAPRAVISRIYPLAGNEAVIGHDLLADPDRRLQAQAAVSSRRLTVAGPFQLRQGGAGLVGRLAVHLPAPGAPGAERFWGLVTAVIRLDPLLEAAQLQRAADAGYRWQLTRLDPERGEVQCFAGCAPLGPDPVTFQVSVPNGDWTLGLAPLAGWPAPPWRTAAWLVVLLGALALAGLAHQLLRQPELLRREVAARTLELARANASLADEMSRLKVAEEATRAAEERLRQAQKLEAIGQLAGGIAHDFNNLLTGILGHASLLEAESPPGSLAAEAGATISDAARRAAELTRRLLGFARRQPLATLPFDVHAVVGDVVRLLSRTLDARVEVRQALAAERVLVVVGDPVQLQQALLNLAFNARDAMDGQGLLTLETELVARDEAWCARHPGAATGPHVAIRVRDTGHGIPADLHHRVFEPFFTTKEEGRGTGLGLAMVYGIARAHGGGVELESRSGEGACFTISLPLAPPGVAPAASVDRVGPPRAASGRVLVVDDDEVPRVATAAMLRACGYEPVVTASGEEGLRWFQAHPGQVRAVLLDVAMPGMDGVACLAALRRLDPGVRVIFASGYARDEQAQALVARGEAGFLPKPYDRAQLALAIEGPASGAGAAPPG